jgi:hypothetical protein
MAQRNPTALFFGVSAFCALAALISIMPPGNPWITVLFFIIVAFGTYALTLYIVIHGKRALLITVGVVIFLLLRLVGLRNPLYVILLVASLASLELMRTKR